MMAASEKLKVKQTTTVSGQIDPQEFKAEVAGKGGAGSQDCGCPECQANNRAGKQKAG